jgi:hypothetical protein
MGSLLYVTVVKAVEMGSVLCVILGQAVGHVVTVVRYSCQGSWTCNWDD